jgi:hypothetical protein
MPSGHRDHLGRLAVLPDIGDPEGEDFCNAETGVQANQDEQSVPHPVERS